MNSFDLIASRVIMRARGRESRFHFTVYPKGLRVMRPIIWEKTENCKNHAGNSFFFFLFGMCETASRAAYGVEQ